MDRGLIRWERGWRAMESLPRWLFFALLPWYAWLDILVPRRRLVVMASLAAFSLLTYLKLRVGLPNGDSELGWGEIALLSLGLAWFPFLMIAIAYPFYLVSVFAGLLVSRSLRNRRPSDLV